MLCTSRLNVKSRVIKPLAVGPLEWKFMSPARVTFGVRSGIESRPKSAEVQVSVDSCPAERLFCGGVVRLLDEIF